MIHRSALIIAVAGLIAPSAQAATGSAVSAAGTALATAVPPLAITSTRDLNFGEIARPAAAGSVTVGPDGTVSSAGGAAGNEAIAQTSVGPSTGQFTITAGTGVAFSIVLPGSFTIARNGRTMTVAALTSSLAVISADATTTTYRLDVGGTLALAANQTVGNYTGTYTVQAVYQ